jgi:hypothetical protein
MSQRTKVPPWPEHLSSFEAYLAHHGVKHGLTVRALDNATRSYHAERLAFATAHGCLIDGHDGPLYRG